MMNNFFFFFNLKKDKMKWQVKCSLRNRKCNHLILLYNIKVFCYGVSILIKKRALDISINSHQIEKHHQPSSFLIQPRGSASCTLSE